MKRTAINSPVILSLTKQELGFIAFAANCNLMPSRRPVQLRDFGSGKTLPIAGDRTLDLPAEDVVLLTFEMR